MKQNPTLQIARWCRAVDVALEARPWLWLSPLLLLFILLSLSAAHSRAFWFDEIFTIYLAGLPSFGKIVDALRVPVDSSPPLLYCLTKGFLRLTSDFQVAARLPSILGFLGMLVCIFLILRWHTRALYGVAGVLVPFVTGAMYYATEARPYGLMLGTSALALLAWERTTDVRLRPTWIMTLAAALIAAISSHYYAVFVFIAIGCGELAHTIQQRRIRPLVWAAILLGFSPMIAWLPLMRANMILKRGTFTPADWDHFAYALRFLYFTGDGILFVPLAVAVGFAIAVARKQNGFGTPPLPALPRAPLVAWLTLFATPLWAYLIGIAYTGVMASRYALLGTLGFSILVPIITSRLTSGSPVGACALLSVSLLDFLWRSLLVVYWPYDPRITPDVLRPALSTQLPVVIGDHQAYLPTVYYADSETKKRLYYIWNPEQALQHTGETTAEMVLGNLRLITPLAVVNEAEFFATQRQFVLIWPGKGWVLPELPRYGAKVERLPGPATPAVYRVTLPARVQAGGP